MTEKIRVSIPESLSDLLRKDCEDFKIVKANGLPNMNSFINLLLVNYYEEFAGAEEKLHDRLRAALAAVPEYYREKALSEVIRALSKKSEDTDGTRSRILSFKPSRQGEKAVLYIGNILLQEESLSSFYRRLFLSYGQKRKNEREKVIHKENYLLLQKALKKGVKVCIEQQNGNVVREASLYSVGASKDELFNYVLFCNEKQNVTLRLANIRSVSLLPAKASVPQANGALFDRQLACAIQYPMYSSDREPIRVRLTENGVKQFRKIYLYRPTPVGIDGDVYTFDCSANQALYYFERFGDSAMILSPKKLGIFMRNYYYFAYKKYKNLYPKD